jgi:uncharacterized protein (DUF1778 family)
MSKKPVAETGGKRMAKLGYKPSQLWYTQEEYNLVQEAALAVRRPMTQFAILATVAEAKRVLREAKNAEKAEAGSS